MPASPKKIAEMREANEAKRKRDAFRVHDFFYDTLDEVLARTSKDQSGKYGKITLGTVYKEYQDKKYNDVFSVRIASKDILIFADKIKEAYENIGWRKVDYIYPKKMDLTLDDIELCFFE